MWKFSSCIYVQNQPDVVVLDFLLQSNPALLNLSPTCKAVAVTLYRKTDYSDIPRYDLCTHTMTCADLAETLRVPNWGVVSTVVKAEILSYCFDEVIFGHPSPLADPSSFHRRTCSFHAKNNHDNPAVYVAVPTEYPLVPRMSFSNTFICRKCHHPNG